MILTKSYGLQKETRQYLKRLYAYGRELESSDIIDIDNFIDGCKQLNLWENIVCWPMRSQYNIGHSSALLSLGGLGRYDGLMYNSPSWSNDGIIFNGSSHYIEFSNPIRSSNIANIGLFASIDSDATTNGARSIMSSYSGAGSRGPLFTVAGSPIQGGSLPWLMFDSTFDGTAVIFPVPGGALFGGNTSLPETVSAGYLDGKRYIEYNNVRSSDLNNVASVFNNNATWRIGARLDNASYFLGNIAFSLFSNKGLTSTQYSVLSLLYKTTIGKGLGLP
jgi:hypothetical protein